MAPAGGVGFWMPGSTLGSGWITPLLEFSLSLRLPFFFAMSVSGVVSSFLSVAAAGAASTAICAMVKATASAALTAPNLADIDFMVVPPGQGLLRLESCGADLPPVKHASDRPEDHRHEEA